MQANRPTAHRFGDGPRPFADRSVVTEAFPRIAEGYFDSASIGLVPRAVGEAVAACYSATGAGVRGARHWHDVIEQTASDLAAEFEVAADEILFMASTGEALNAIARAVPWRAGDEVVALDDEFPSVMLPWSRLGHDVKLVTASPHAGDDRLGALMEAITPRTRLVAASHVHSTTGTRIDLDALGAECRRVGAILVCDGAQAAGSMPVDLSHVDFYVATGYKWLLAGFGVAMVIAKRDSMADLRPTLLGHANIPPHLALPYGHTNAPGVFALNAAAKVRRRIGLDTIHHTIATLVRQLHEGTTALGLQPAAALDRSASIVSLAGAGDPASAVRYLADAGFTVAARGQCLRISPNFYNTEREVADLLDAMRRLPL